MASRGAPGRTIDYGLPEFRGHRHIRRCLIEWPLCCHVRDGCTSSVIGTEYLAVLAALLVGLFRRRLQTRAREIVAKKPSRNINIAATTYSFTPTLIPLRTEISGCRTLFRAADTRFLIILPPMNCDVMNNHTQLCRRPVVRLT